MGTESFSLIFTSIFHYFCLADMIYNARPFTLSQNTTCSSNNLDYVSADYYS